jgi:hypothetical protein
MKNLQKEQLEEREKHLKAICYKKGCDCFEVESCQIKDTLNDIEFLLSKIAA